MVAERKVLEDVGAGKGHLSTVQLIYEKQYGGNVVLKVPVSERAKNVLSIQDGRFEALHNAEVEAYEILNNHQDKGVSFPKIFHLERMQVNSVPVVGGHIVMEYFPRISHLFIEHNLKPEELLEAVEHLARLHSISGDLTEKERARVPNDFLKGWFTELFADKNLELYMTFWNGAMGKLMPSEKSRETIRLLRDILSPGTFEKLNDDCAIFGVGTVFCHGDYASHNLLYEKLPDGSHKFRAICDFQGANWGNAAQDLTRLFVTAMSGKDRRESGQRLLRVYYDELVRMTREKAPFTWQQLTRSYTRFLPLHAAIVCVTTPGRFLRMLGEMKEGTEKEEFERTMLEKYVALMEDMSDAWKEAQVS